MADEKEKLEEMATKSDSPVVQKYATEALEREFEGDEVAQKMIKLTQIMTGMGAEGSDLDVDQVKHIVRKTIEDEKISLDNLDDVVKNLLKGQTTTVKMTVKAPSGKTTTKSVKISPAVQRPLMQKILSDVLARNNVYLYGGAGTGKTYSAKVIAKALGWDLIEIACNQFTSPLELIGGQTIDGYQEGKVIRAWGNIREDGSKMDGCVLLLDELPKIDPNTAGILNSALAKVAEFNREIVGGEEEWIPESIENGRGQKIKRGNVFIMASGNSLLNIKDPEYEANFKQDLSLQDRFVGSTYQVFVDVEYEWTDILYKKWAFIAIYLNNLRKIIVDEGFQSKAFVSIRIMQSVQKTYKVYRYVKSMTIKSATVQPDPDTSLTPAPYSEVYPQLNKKQVKSVEDSMNEFFSLFTEEQASILKERSKYDAWLRIVREKDGIPLDKLNTPEELEEMDRIIKNAKAEHRY